MALELKHLASYLPYKVRFISSMDKPFDRYGVQPIWTLDGVNKLFGNYCLLTEGDLKDLDAYTISSCKLVLRPLSDLTKEIEHNGERFVPGEYISGRYNTHVGEWFYLFKRDVLDINDAPQVVFKKLLEWHFDVFGLIDKGLAIDINNVESIGE